MSQLDSYKIWHLVEPVFAPADFSLPPFGLNYKTGLYATRLNPVLDMFRGELMQVKYYANIVEVDGEKPLFTDLILCVDIQWERDANNRLAKRTEVRKWTVGASTDAEPVFGPDTKTTFKVYNQTQAAIADVRRRNNIIEELTARAAEFGAEIPNQKMRRTLDNEMNAYVNTGADAIIGAVYAYVDPDNIPWLEAQTSVLNPETGQMVDLTVRQAIMAQLQIGAVTA